MYLFFDTETDGLPKDWKAPITNFQNWPRIVSIAWLLTELDGTPVSEGNFIVKPGDFVIPPNMIHGISHAQAMEQGHELRHVMLDFFEAAKQCTYLVAHNINFDEKIVGCELFRLGMQNIMVDRKQLCTMMSSTKFCQIENGKGGYKWPKLTELHQKLFGAAFDGAHDAMNDIRATAACFFELQNKGIIEKHTTQNDMPAIKDKSGKIVGFTKDEPTKEIHQGTALSDEEYKAKYEDMPMNLPSKKAPLPPPAKITVTEVKDTTFTEDTLTDEQQFWQQETADQNSEDKATLEQLYKQQSPLHIQGEPLTEGMTITDTTKRKRRTKAEMLAATAEAAKSTPSDFQEGDPAPNPIVALIPTFGVEKETGLKVVSELQKFFDKAAEWKRIADELVVEDVNDTAKMKMAKDARLGLKNFRGLSKELVEEKRGALKAKMAPFKAEDDLWLTGGQLVETTFKTIEKIFEEKEKFAAEHAKKQKETLHTQRLEEIKPYIDSDPSYLNFREMTEADFQKVLSGAKAAFDTKKLQEEKDAKELEEKKNANDKLIADRLAMLEGVQYNGQQATYAGRIVATKDSLLSLSDVAFKAVVEGHAKQVIVEKKIASQQRLASRIQYMVALGMVNKDGGIYLNDELVVSEEDLELYADDKYLPWITEWADWLKAEEAKEQAAKDAELKAAKEKADAAEAEAVKAKRKSREMILLGIGLNTDANGIWHHHGNEYVSEHTINQMIDSDFEIAVNNFKIDIQNEFEAKKLADQQAALETEAAKPDLEKIDQLIADLNNFQLPAVNSIPAANLVAGTKKLLGKITAWLESQKSGI